MNCRTKPYNANGDLTSMTTVSSSGVVSDLTPRDASWTPTATLDGKESIVKMVYENCKKIGLPDGVDWTWILAIPGQESAWNPSNRNSESGAGGLFQFMPQFFPFYQKKAGCSGNILDADCNTKAAIYLFNENWNHVNNTVHGFSLVDKIWAAYICHNAGSGNFDTYYTKAKKPDNIKAVIQSISNTEAHDFPIKVNAYHNYVVDWLSKNTNAINS